MLELTDIYKSYRHNGNTIEVLKGISITINQGDTLAIIGASGAGKSTLLNIMGGLERPSSGHMKIQGRDIVGLDETALCRMRNREIGFVFQFHHLLPEFNAIENTLMPALISRMGKKEAMDMARNMLNKVGLENRLNHRIGELSGGEQQRVAIARALMMRPKILLADEPTGNLDRNTGKEVVDHLLRIREEENLSMVIVTHNQQLADNMTKVMEIVDGKLQ
ncbi:MAG: ABC transporter ATP-binding protein [Desulfatiglans sp.]|jgi:lipoprotein-releasing system ATP-binding protein|nr:ABC transporter ATP-binding protein [Desulfatiglans sp.]